MYPLYKFYLCFVLLFAGFFPIAKAMHPDIYFTPNKGQWHENIRYTLRLNHGFMYLEDQGITYLFVSGEEHDETGHGHIHDNPEFHSLKVHYLGSNPSPTYLESEKASFYQNFYLGNDPSRWKSGVYASGEVRQQEIYPGIDLIYTGTENRELKYDYIIDPGADPSLIRWKYEGAEELFVADGELHIATSLGTVIEKKPVAWQFINEEKVYISCDYVLNGNEISFTLGDEYDPAYGLVIDPVLIFSSFSGSTANNFGFTATYDVDKNTYGGGIAFSSGYPTTAGAFQTSFNSSSELNQRDIAISKFSASGNTLIYSTYLGGAGTEAPHSLVVSDDDELYMYGTTSSANFPMVNSYDGTFNGGDSIPLSMNGLFYNSGSDIVIARFNAAGTALLGSTYIGGSANDGLNIDTDLHYNYGDVFRGEITIDHTGNCVVASVTASSNFPVNGSFQNTYGGGTTDGVLFKLAPGLNSLLWSTYFGGNGADAAYGVQISSTNSIYFTGGTSSSTLPVTAGVVGPVSHGGIDGFVTGVTASGLLQSCSYLGTSAYDQSYFVQLDSNDDVYVFGQTTGNYPVMPSTVYSNPGSGQFIQKLNGSLTTTLFSTSIGRSNTGHIDISPTAFLVNNCGLIYLSGWGGTTNNNLQPNASSTIGLPVTADAFQSTTDGSDFYLMILAPDADSLIYGSFMGGVSTEHVDGGTSRFDKAGVIYQAVCAGCQSNSSFPTTPGVWSNVNGSMCNLAVFKFDMQTAGAATVNFTSQGCDQLLTVDFNINASSQVSCYWDFGDGSTSTDQQPSHTYTSPGAYDVTLITVDAANCFATDTLNLTVEYPGPMTITVSPPDTICIGDTTSLSVSGATFFNWSPGIEITDPASDNPSVFPSSSTTFSVVGSDAWGCTDTASVYIHVLEYVEADYEIDYDICVFPTPVSLLNSSVNGIDYYWDLGNGFTSVNADEQHVFTSPGEYTITLVAVDSNSCNISDTSVQAIVIRELLSITTSPADTICIGQSTQISASGASVYTWSPSASLNDAALADPIAEPTSSGTYTVIGTDTLGCQDTASVYVHVLNYTEADYDIAYNPCMLPNPVSFLNESSNSVNYYWDFGNGFSSVNTDEQVVYTQPGTYTITLVAIDSASCNISDTSVQTVFIPVLPVVSIGDVDSICSGENVIATATGASTYIWFPDYNISNTTEQSPVFSPDESTEYFVIGTDTNGCSDTASFTINVFPVIYIDAGPDFIIEVWDSPSLVTVIPDEGSYYWTPPTGLSCTDCPNPEATPEFNTWYYLHYMDLNGCEYIDSMQVIVAPSVFIPNAFTPDMDDDLNDYFVPVVRNLSYYEFYIFNRWGQLIFYSEEQGEGWDGTYNGEDCPVDVYVWRIKYSDYITPANIIEKLGHVTLIR